LASVAVLGASHWHARMHLDGARRAGASIAGIWDRDADVARRFAVEHGQTAYATLDEVLAQRPDLCVVMGTPNDMPELVAPLLTRGVPLVVEKPAALNGAALAPLCDIAHQRNSFVAVPLANRYGPLMAEPRLRPVAHAHFRIINGVPERYRADGVGWMLDPAISGGGALRNLGIHGIDCALALARGALTVVSSHIGRQIHTGEAVEDHALVTLRDEAGGIFTIEAGYTFATHAAGGDYAWRIAAPGAYGIDRGEYATLAVLDTETSHELAPLPPHRRYDAFWSDTLARLHTGRAPLVTLADYTRAMDLIDIAYGCAS
jgi:predicted dehydrogenase